MSKQKIIFLIIFLILVALAIFGYFFIKNQEIKVEEPQKTEKESKEEAILKELQSFKKPTKEIQIPQSEASVDPTIKTDAEVITEIESFVPTKTENKPTDIEILKLLQQAQ
jgi:flagellar basal body-associated protein FliL